MDSAILFADVAGSRALYEILGDTRAFAVVGSCLETMSACTTEVHGRVVKTIGDAVMAVFKDADEAAAAAAEMQMRVDNLGTASGSRILDGQFRTVGVAMAVPENHPAALGYLHEFIEEIKVSGEVQKALESAGLSADMIAPPVTRQ